MHPIHATCLTIAGTLHFFTRSPSAECMYAARELSEKQPEFAAKGVKLLGVVHEKLGVEDFASGFFKNGGVYFDEEKAFFNGKG